MRHFTFIDTPIGRLAAVEENAKLVFLGAARDMPADAVEGETPLFAKLRTELGEYFAGARREFDIPLGISSGTPWRRKCWEGLLSIPCGQTKSYGWLAAFAGNPKGARAAGGACHANPILILVPCHRVLGADGSLTGFGPGTDVKRRLLALERTGRIND
ncbi:MAG TPA: methylated-DNA--[protein]-cysteine S-methyltransferase [Clostridia bacterium]|nr:methylated-DNA--[protein]-cysteine S-methyltransferase [Clostridia bacterium]